MSLVGTSGCGKSTLLSIVAGLQDVDSGVLLSTARRFPALDSIAASYSSPIRSALAHRQQNVEFALKAAGLPRRRSLEIAREHLKLVKLEKFADAYPSQLSGGMKQRVAIARALSYRPKMLLMDEPFGALDALTRRQMQELLTRIWEEHRLTVLFVTHDVEEAVYLSDRIEVMATAPGRIRETFPVPLARPRHPEMAATTEFIDLQRRVVASIREGSAGADTDV